MAVTQRTQQAVDDLFADPQVLEIPTAEALNSKTSGDSDTYTEED